MATSSQFGSAQWGSAEWGAGGSASSADLTQATPVDLNAEVPVGALVPAGLVASTPVDGNLEILAGQLSVSNLGAITPVDLDLDIPAGAIQESAVSGSFVRVLPDSLGQSAPYVGTTYSTTNPAQFGPFAIDGAIYIVTIRTTRPPDVLPPFDFETFIKVVRSLDGGTTWANYSDAPVSFFIDPVFSTVDDDYTTAVIRRGSTLTMLVQTNEAPLSPVRAPVILDFDTVTATWGVGSVPASTIDGFFGSAPFDIAPVGTNGDDGVLVVYPVQLGGTEYVTRAVVWDRGSDTWGTPVNVWSATLGPGESRLYLFLAGIRNTGDNAYDLVGVKHLSSTSNPNPSPNQNCDRLGFLHAAITVTGTTVVVGSSTIGTTTAHNNTSYVGFRSIYWHGAWYLVAPWVSVYTPAIASQLSVWSSPDGLAWTETVIDTNQANFAAGSPDGIGFVIGQLCAFSWIGQAETLDLYTFTNTYTAIQQYTFNGSSWSGTLLWSGFETPGGSPSAAPPLVAVISGTAGSTYLFVSQTRTATTVSDPAGVMYVYVSTVTPPTTAQISRPSSNARRMELCPNVWDANLGWSYRSRLGCEPEPPVCVDVDGRFKLTPGGRMVLYSNSVALPAPGVDQAVLTLRAPMGYRVNLLGLVHFWTGVGFVQASGDLAWRVRLGSRYLDGLGNMQTYLGSLMEGPWETPYVYNVGENWTVTYIVSHASTSTLAGGRIICQLYGWLYPY